MVKFVNIINNSHIFLQCGSKTYDVPAHYKQIPFIWVGLDEEKTNHIQHDIIRPFPLKTNSVDLIQAEDIIIIKIMKVFVIK